MKGRSKISALHVVCSVRECITPACSAGEAVVKWSPGGFLVTFRYPFDELAGEEVEKVIRRGQEAAQMLTSVRSAEEGAQLDAFNQLLVIRQLLLASHRHGWPRPSCLLPLVLLRSTSANLPSILWSELVVMQPILQANYFCRLACKSQDLKRSPAFYLGGYKFRCAVTSYDCGHFCVPAVAASFL